MVAPPFKKKNLWRQDKGQNNCVQAFLRSVENGTAPAIPAEELFEIARITIKAAEIIRTQEVKALNPLPKTLGKHFS